MSEILRGNKHGFILYRASHAKPHANPWATNDAIQSEHYQRHVSTGATSPLQFELPRVLPQMIASSPYDRPDPLLAEQAAARLFSPTQYDFALAADAAARHHLGIHPDAQHQHFTHLHGIGSWESKLEPSMLTVFHQPITPSHLQKIAADVGSWARQEGILAFVPHSGGTEQMLHLRYPSHNSLIKKLSPGLVSDIAQRVTNEFNNYFDTTPQGVKEYLMPGRSILPDTEGHTDVMVWVPPWADAASRGRMHDAFHEIAHKLNGGVQYWRGTGKIIGGLHPYDYSADLSDTRKREVANENYKKALALPPETTQVHPGDVELPHYEPVESEHLERSPAKSGIVVRGVYYKPGAIIPDLITSKDGPIHRPSVRITLEDFKERIRKAKRPKHADDASTGAGHYRSS